MWRHPTWSMPKSPAKRKAAPPRWKRRPSSLVCAWLKPSLQKKRGSKRLAGGNPGTIGARCDVGLLRGTYERCRGESTAQTTISVITDEVLTFGLESWSRGQKVRLLLLFAQVECRPSWAPPISMDILSTRQRLMAIRVNAHCLRG